MDIGDNRDSHTKIAGADVFWLSAECWLLSAIWRRGRDSNPRYPLRYGRFRGGSFQPLTHLSAPCRNVVAIILAGVWLRTSPCCPVISKLTHLKKLLWAQAHLPGSPCNARK